MSVRDAPVSRRHAHFTPDDRAELAAIARRTVEMPAGMVASEAGDPLTYSLLLLEGFMCRRVECRDGARQIVALQIAGDFVDLHAYPLKVLDHDVVTMTEARVAVFEHADLDALRQRRPDLALKLWHLTLVDAATHRQWILRVGKLTAIARIAHCLCETMLRLMAIGACDGRSFGFPITQAQLGEVCGLTSVHVNRVLRELRDSGVCTIRGGVVSIHRPAPLISMAQIDPGYLYLEDDIVERFKQLASDPGG